MGWNNLALQEKKYLPFQSDFVILYIELRSFKMNMSYCMFENTVSDMRDCVRRLRDWGWDVEELMENASTEHEKKAIANFVKLCREVSEEVEDYAD